MTKETQIENETSKHDPFDGVSTLSWARNQMGNVRLHFMKNAIITGIMAATILMAGSPSSVAQTQERAIVTKAKSIVLSEFKLDGVTLQKAVRQLQIAAKQSDPNNGINFMVTKPATTAASPKITLALKKVTVEEAAKRIAKAAGVSVSAQDYAFVFDAKSETQTPRSLGSNAGISPKNGTVLSNGGFTWNVGAVVINGSNVPVSDIKIRPVQSINH